MKEERYDFVILGAGSVGLIAAEFAAKLGVRVALIERDRIGGDCTWTGCVPSKALIKAAKVAQTVRTAGRFGIQTAEPITDMPAVRDHLRGAIDSIYAGTTPEALERKGIQVVLGSASFIDPHLIAVGERRLRAAKILIATGASPAVPAVAGLSAVRYSTYRDIFDRDALPSSLIVLGGGPIGVELAQAYQRLGTAVTVFAPHLLPREEPEVAEVLGTVLRREGVRIVPERLLSVEQSAGGITARSETACIEGEVLLVAAGRVPTVDGLRLDVAGIHIAKRGVQVDTRLRSSVPHIFAAGDVTGGEQYSHLAGWQGFQAARNALLPGSASGMPSALPRVTFTDPEVASVGATEAAARASNNGDVAVRTWPIAREDRAVCDGDLDGFLKIITTRSGTILGSTIVGHRAGDIISEVALAMQHRIGVSGVAGSVHAYPTYASGLQLLASEMAVDALLSGAKGKVVRSLARLRARLAS